MNKISKFACSFVLALSATTVYTNVSFGMNPEKDFPEYILKNKLQELNKEKEKEKTSWFNKFYLHKLYGDEAHYLNDIIASFFLSIGVSILLNYLIPESKNSENNGKLKTNIKSLILIGTNLSCQFGLGHIVHQHKIRTTVRNENIKNLEEILGEMKKSKGKI